MAGTIGAYLVQMVTGNILNNVTDETFRRFPQHHLHSGLVPEGKIPINTFSK